MSGWRIPFIFLFVTLYVAALSMLLPYVGHLNQYFQAMMFAGFGFVLALILFISLSEKQKTACEPEADSEEIPAWKEPQGGAEEPLADEKLVDDNVVQLLSLLQQKGRFIDFLTEDVSVFDDSQVGAAARAIHQGCKAALDEHISISAVIENQEGDEIEVSEGYDPSTIRLTGNVIGNPPFRGIVRHPGWRATEMIIPSPAGARDRTIIEPAEIEVM